MNDDRHRILTAAEHPMTTSPPEEEQSDDYERNADLPESSVGRVQLVESTEERLVFFIPGGDSGLGCFAIAWNLFMVVFTAGSFAAGAWRDMTWVGFVAVFWGVGIVLAYFAVKMRFERVFLAIEHDQAVLKRGFLNREKLETIQVNTATRVGLVESYQQNDDPVYRVEIQSPDGKLKFGTGLQDNEKNFLVDTIREFLKPISADGTSAESSAVVDADPSTPFPHDKVTIVENTPSHLQLHLDMCGLRRVKWALGGFFLAFSVIWYVFGWEFPIGFRLNNVFDVIGFAFHVVHLIVGLIPLGLMLMVFFGRISIDVDSEEFRLRWYVGPLGYSRRLSRSEIERVELRLASENSSQSRLLQNPSSPSLQTHRICTVRTRSGKWFPLTLIQNEETSRHVCKLVREQLAIDESFDRRTSDGAES